MEALVDRFIRPESPDCMGYADGEGGSAVRFDQVRAAPTAGKGGLLLSPCAHLLRTAASQPLHCILLAPAAPHPPSPAQLAGLWIIYASAVGVAVVCGGVHHWLIKDARGLRLLRRLRAKKAAVNARLNRAMRVSRRVQHSKSLTQLAEAHTAKLELEAEADNGSGGANGACTVDVRSGAQLNGAEVQRIATQMRALLQQLEAAGGA